MTNVIEKDGRTDRQPCEKCKVIAQTTLDDDVSIVCPHCGAWWVSLNDDDAQHKNSLGCALMSWSFIIGIVLLGLWLASKLHGGIK